MGVIYTLIATEIFSTSTIFILKTKGSSGGGNLSQLALLAGINMGSNNNIDPSDYLDKIIQDKEFISKLYEKKWFFKGDSLPLEQIYEIKPDTTVSDFEYMFSMKKIETIRKGNVLSINKDSKTGILTPTSNAPTSLPTIGTFTINYIQYIQLHKNRPKRKEFIEERIKETKEILQKECTVMFKERNLSIALKSST